MTPSTLSLRAGPRALVVSIHDVAPATRPAVEEILAALGRHGIGRCSLLVVPDYHRSGRSLADEGFCRWLHSAEENGHEVVMHGYFHLRAAQPGERFWSRLITQSYTAGEGEFFDLGYESAARLLARGQDEFARAGFAPEGFIAPAWLLGAEAERAVAAAGFRYTTRLTEVLELAPERRRERSQSLVWSVRSGWRRAVSVAWNALLSQREWANPLLRIGIHPVDFAHPAIWRQVCRLTARAAAERAVTTYAEWVRNRGKPEPATAAGVGSALETP